MVDALAISGPIFYLGGGFQSVGGQARGNLAAVDLTSGAVSAWNPDTDSRVMALALAGPAVYVGGFFERIGGEDHNSLAAVDAATGG